MAECLHEGYVETKRKYIEEVLRYKDYQVIKTIIFCIYVGPEHPMYNLNLLAASMHLYSINSLVYKGKDGYRKLPKRRYEVRLFKGFAETEEEVEIILKRLGFMPTEEEVSEVYKVLYAIKPLVLYWISDIGEIAYASTFGYHIDYCIKNHVTYLPEPKIKVLMPENYPDDWEGSSKKGASKLLSDIVGYC